jgi:hypothetical protein
LKIRVVLSALRRSGKRDKRSEKTWQIIRAALAFIKAEGRMTLRHLYYLLVSAHIILNSMKEYRAVSKILTDARERGDVPYEAIRDGVRSAIRYSTWDTPAEFAEDAAASYRKDLWSTQRDVVECWFEKDSVIGVVEDIGREYCVTMRPLRGQASTSFMYENAEDVAGVTKNLYVYYFGDHDASGYSIERSARQRLVELLLDEFHWTPADVIHRLRWKRLGFLQSDFAAHNIRAVDAKPSDANYKKFVAEFGTDAAELEALPPHELRGRVVQAIESHLDMAEWNRMKQIEAAERESWREAMGKFGRK